MKSKTLIAVLLLCFSAQAQTRQNSRKMAVTIDDLPYVVMDDGDYLPNAQRATRDILRALKTYHVPVVGFVNEARLQANGEVKARIVLLEQWINAGAILGNHTYSHPDFNRLTTSVFCVLSGKRFHTAINGLPLQKVGRTLHFMLTFI